MSMKGWFNTKVETLSRSGYLLWNLGNSVVSAIPSSELRSYRGTYWFKKSKFRKLQRGNAK